MILFVPSRVISFASVPEIEYFRSLQYAFEKENDPKAILVFYLVGVSFTTAGFHAEFP